MRDAGHHGAEDDRRDQHLDQLDEPVAARLDPVVGGVGRLEPAEQRAEYDGNQHLDIENPVPGLCRTHRCVGRNYCRHDVHSPSEVTDFARMEMRFRWITAKSFGPAESMPLLRWPLLSRPRFPDVTLRARLEQPPNRRHKRGAARAL